MRVANPAWSHSLKRLSSIVLVKHLSERGERARARDPKRKGKCMRECMRESARERKRKKERAHERVE